MYEHVVASFFRITNFVAVIAAVVFLFRKYFLSKLYAEWLERKRHRIDLAEQGRSLKVHCRSLDNEMQTLVDKGSYLRGRLQMWGEMVARRVQEQEREHGQLRIQLEKLHGLQEENITERRLRQEIVHQLFVVAKEQLVRHYANERGRQAVEQMINKW